MEQDYLDFDGLINFLDQKGYKWNARRTTDLLLEAITDSKLTPVFFYRGEITVTYAKFVGENKWEEVKKDTCRLQGYFSANAYDLVDLYQDYFTCVPNALTFNGQHVRPYKIFGNPAPIVTDYQKRTEGIETYFLHLSCGSFIDGYRHTVTDFLYPVEQLDNMFYLHYRDPLAIQLEKDMNETLTQDVFNDSEVGTASFLEPARLPKDKKIYTELGINQKLLVGYEAFTFEQIICLIVDSDPESFRQDEKFLSYCLAIEKAQEIDRLTPLSDNRPIPAQQVKEWLARHNFIYKGFNDNIPTDPIAQIEGLREQLIAAYDTIDELNNVKKISKNKIAHLNSQLKQSTDEADALRQQENTPADTSDQLTERSKKSYQVTIGLLLELLMTPKGFDNKGEPNKPLFQSEASIIRDIEEKSIYGQGKTKLEGLFKAVKITLADVKKK